MHIPTLVRSSRSVTSCVALAVFVWGSLPLTAQRSPTTSPPSPFYAPPGAAAEADEQEEIYELSPFSVEASENQDRYRATATLAGTRVRTDLKDIASSISVITAQFLQDTGAKNSQDLLVYTTNTEVGGVYGNYAGVGSTFVDGASEASNFLKPSQNTRVRGLDSADNTRDYFLTDIPWDAYIVDRVDLQRGPNSILFGIGSPAGVVNSSVNTARFGSGGRVENRFDENGSLRFSLDYNHELIDDQLAIRISGLDDDTKYRQKPAFNHDRRIFTTLRWDPQISGDSAHTSFRVNYEHGKVRANRPRVLPPQDRITPFFAPNGINRQTWDPWYAWAAGVVPYSSDEPAPGESKNFWLVQYPGPGVQATANPMFNYDGSGATTPSSVRQAGPTTYWGLAADGTRDASINGFPYGSNIGIASYNEFAFDHWRVYGDDGDDVSGLRFPAADKGFYKTKSITDKSIFNFYNNLIDGPNKRETQDWDAYNVAFEQTVLNNRLGIELVYDHQEYDDLQSRNLNNTYISVDVRENLMVYPGDLPGLAVPNPNAGRAFVGSGVKNGGNSSNTSERDSFRATLFGELRAEDLFGESRFSEILGRHLFTGLISRDEYEVENRNWVRYAVEEKWSDRIGQGGDGSNPSLGSNAGGLTNGDVVLDWVTYLSGDLRTENDAHGLNLGRITGIQSPSGSHDIPYFDSHWNAEGVDPGAAWFNPARGKSNDPPGEMTTQSENPENYVGWVTDSFNILNADEGDVSRLYTDISRVKKKTDSEGITWQGYLWDETLVATVGYREDKQSLRSGSSAASDEPTGYAIPNPDYDPDLFEEEGSSTSWGLVYHVPEAVLENIADGFGLSLHYSRGRNTRVENRFGFDGASLESATGETDDVGIAASFLNNRLRFKATHYKTKVQNANLSSVTTEVSTLGNNTYYLRNLEAWGTGSALLNLAGRDGAAPGWEWYWNWAHIAEGWTPESASPTSEIFLTHPETAAQTTAIESWLDQMPEQSWFDAYGFPVNVAAARAGDWAGAIAGWSPTAGVGGIQPSGLGRINGVWPTGTVDNVSKGWEYELSGQLSEGWNVTMNASKTHASQTALGENLVNFIEASYEKYQSPAGDLRLWWGGDQTVRDYYTQNIWAAYQFQLDTNGKLVPEMSPWRLNVVTNYAFGEQLRGFNIGGGYRWQQATILGYGLNAEEDNLDVNRPFWGDSQSAVDLWLGYERDVSDKLRWRVQLNVRNVGDSAHLIPISVQPDGSPGGFRINPGSTWTLTNTFSF